MKALALDFDGVICNSARETYLVGASTYADFYPSSPLVQRLGDHPEPPGAGAPETPEFAAFSDLLPLGNRAEDFGVAFRAIDLGIRLVDQESYDEFYSSLDQGWRNEYHNRFYRQRALLRDGDRDAWLRLHSTYPAFIDVLRRRSADVYLAVASAKDADSARLLLEAFGIADLFASGSILDKETGVHKTDHMRLLQARLGIGFDEITFVDDKINHLIRVAELGVRPVLAGWGFNTDREHRMAERMRILVAGLDSFEDEVFGG
jgi:phosphoglycolate phosphatase-like HAD superfamily hydrolase